MSDYQFTNEQYERLAQLVGVVHEWDSGWEPGDPESIISMVQFLRDMASIDRARAENAVNGLVEVARALGLKRVCDASDVVERANQLVDERDALQSRISVGAQGDW